MKIERGEGVVVGTQDQRPARVATKTRRTKDPKNLDHQYHPHHTPDTSPRRSSAPRYARHLCIRNAAPKRRGEVSNVKSLSIRRKGRYVGTNALYKCHIGLCTPRRTIMEAKKKKKRNGDDIREMVDDISRMNGVLSGLVAELYAPRGRFALAPLRCRLYSKHFL